VMTDPTQMHQVLMNLATNAYHAMGDSGVLEIGLRQVEVSGGKVNGDIVTLPDGGYVVLEVTDNGAGMDALTLKRIFEPYFTTKDMEKGAGLGLSMVHGIVGAHHGEIKVSSEPGRGTRFRIYLPAIDEKKEEGKEKNPVASGGGERIMLVDDEEDNLRLATRILEGLGYRVDPYADSGEALRAFEKAPEEYDLVITDMSMPGMNGEELSMRILEARPEAVIVLCTGFSDVLTEGRAREIGIREYLMKPYVIKDLADVVGRALGRKEGADDDPDVMIG